MIWEDKIWKWGSNWHRDCNNCMSLKIWTTSMK